MWTMTISSGILAFLVMIILFRHQIQIERVKSSQIENFKSKRRYIDEELELSLWDRFVKPNLKKLSAQLSKMNKPRRSKNPQPRKAAASEIDKNLRLAGLRIHAQEFTFIRIASAVLFMFGGLALAGVIFKEADLQFLVFLVGMTIGIIAPTFTLRYLVKNRQEQIENQLPTVMDILSVSIEAGLGFDAALLKVVDRYEGPLIDELAQLYREIQMGKPRREALAALIERSNVAELQTFVTSVIQADQFGTPMKNVLNSQAIQLRVSRRQKAQEKGMKAPVRMVLPMVIFIFPVIFIVLLGPTVIQLIEQFSG